MANKSNSAESRLVSTSHPLLYEVNTRVLLNELSSRAGKRVTLKRIPDAVLDEWQDLGFDAIWLMGVWTTGKLGLQIARDTPSFREEYKRVLPDLTDDDIIGSPYAIKSYTVSRKLGGNSALAVLRKRLQKRGLGLVLDFVCNHTARDHSWVSSHPEYYVNGAQGDEAEKPDQYFRTKTSKGERVVAYGRDPYFPGWTDTAQLNYFHPGARRAMLRQLNQIAEVCDGVRCDMAMLVLNEVFDRTWGERVRPLKPPPEEFWKEAIAKEKLRQRDFLFIAEAYWNLEWQLQQLGFDYTYDKILYERLLREGAQSVFGHFKAELDYQRKCVRFIENHDEPRAAAVLSTEAWHCAAGVVMSTVPGMALYHRGQLEGRRIKLPVQLGRLPEEPESDAIKGFYRRLFRCLQSSPLRQGTWQLLEARPAWNENHTWTNFLAFMWKGKESGARLVVVNYAPHNGQCYINPDLAGIDGSPIEFRDVMGFGVFVRERTALASKGMYFDVPAYGIHIFEVSSTRHSNYQ